MNSAINQSRRAGRIRKDGWPLTEFQVRREDQAFVFIAPADELKEQVRVAVIVG